MSTLKILPCLDSAEMAASRRKELDISREFAIYQTRVVVQAVETGTYSLDDGSDFDWRQLILDACVAKRSIPPSQKLDRSESTNFDQTLVQVSNETSLAAALRMISHGMRPLVLNFANGERPGGGFHGGARAQEESMCRCSALYWTLAGDPMYLAHSYRERPDSSNWAILSPTVPVFRNEQFITYPQPVLVDFVTCAAPYAYKIGQPESAVLLRDRIHRVLSIASAYGYQSLVLGAWGCGAFGNDIQQTAQDFRTALESNFAGCFSSITFAITDWSSERRFLGPFRDVFNE